MFGGHWLHCDTPEQSHALLAPGILLPASGAEAEHDVVRLEIGDRDATGIALRRRPVPADCRAARTVVVAADITHRAPLETARRSARRPGWRNRHSAPPDERGTCRYRRR